MLTLEGMFAEIATSKDHKKSQVDESNEEFETETTEHESCSDSLCI
jgi:hypothetical protein